MEEKEFKQVTTEIQAELKRIAELQSEVKKEIEKKASSDRIEELVTKTETSELKLKELADQYDALELKMKDRQLGSKPYDPLGELTKAYKEAHDKVKSPGGQMSFTIKGNPINILKAGTIDEGTYLSDATFANAVVVPQRIPGVEKLPDRMIRFTDVVGRGVTNSNRVTWVERSARTEGAAAVTSDTGQYGQSDFTWIQKAAEVEKIGTFIKVTNEALEDWDECLSQIRNELFPMVERELEEELYEGSGITPHLDGIITSAEAYAATGLNAKVTTPNVFDAIRAAAYQCVYYNYMPTHAFLNPADFAEMEMSKNSNGSYIIPPFATANGMIVGGVKVIQSSLVDAGQLLVGDFSKVTLYMRRNLEVKIWDQDSTDPEYDLKTITASCRAAVKFPAPHAYAFVYDAISDITTAITKVSG